jgi:isocitrate/isopropylmalate dehydrogenase
MTRDRGIRSHILRGRLRPPRAPDIKGLGIINPTATMLSSVLMLDYHGFGDKSKRFENAVRKVYAGGKVLTPDQGGSAKTGEFAKAVIASL